MAKEIKWECLTSDEAKTLNELRNNGKEVYAAPIEIEHSEQLVSLGISWRQCRTWLIGNERITVHLTPADEDTYSFLLGELYARHRDSYRQNRCMVPGKTRLIRCPESNSCSNCPFPGCRDHRQPNVISWDEVIENEQHREEPVLAELFEAKRQYEELRERMVREDPLIAEVFTRYHTYDYDAPEISAELGIDKRKVYYLKQQTEQNRDRMMNL